MALGMALEGAEMDTYTAMRDALRLEDLDRMQIAQSYRSLIDLLTDLDPAVTVRVGNSVWYRQGLDLEGEYVAEVERDFDAAVQGLDFADPGAARTINRWVSDATDGWIDSIVDPPIDPVTVAFLINAIYFDGPWTLRFDRDHTWSGDFQRSDGTSTEASFMSMSDARFPYVETPDYRAIELPYGGQAFAMVVVLPPEGVSVSDFVAALDESRWAGIVAGLGERELRVDLPLFRVEYDRLLNGPLTALGMGTAFDPASADLTRMHRNAVDMQLHISKVKQKSYIDVDEDGTRAAAMTSVEMGVTSAPPSFRADRPFVFAVRERLSGTLMFVGVLRDPSSTG
jgi:serpin B